MFEVRHIIPEQRDKFEQQHGITYCRRCLFPIIIDCRPDFVPKECRDVRIELR